jgi:hypothetical protein
MTADSPKDLGTTKMEEGGLIHYTKEKVTEMFSPPPGGI